MLNTPHLFTNRWGYAFGNLPSHELKTGASQAPFDRFNLGYHVPDNSNAVSQNRAQLTDLLAGPVIYPHTNHGSEVWTVTEATLGTTPSGADILISTVPQTAVAAMAADCAVVLLVEKSSGAVAAVHAGWRGVLAGALSVAIAELKKYIRPERLQNSNSTIVAVAGINICGHCYEVGPEVLELFRETYPQAVVPTRKRLEQGADSWGVDLQTALTAQALAAGVNLQTNNGCTFEDKNYFSHRRDGLTGRHAGIIQCQEFYS